MAIFLWEISKRLKQRRKGGICILCLQMSHDRQVLKYALWKSVLRADCLWENTVSYGHYLRRNLHMHCTLCNNKCIYNFFKRKGRRQVAIRMCRKWWEVSSVIKTMIIFLYVRRAIFIRGTFRATAIFGTWPAQNYLGDYLICALVVASTLLLSLEHKAEEYSRGINIFIRILSTFEWLNPFWAIFERFFANVSDREVE